ncbi:MAG: helix-turn-helix domain-containing protein [Candidatus Ornithomonoglobus sp.]
MSKNKHLTYDERVSIQRLLSESKSFAFIAEATGKHRTNAFYDPENHTYSIIIGIIIIASICNYMLA